jgi:hypothetical protein
MLVFVITGKGLAGNVMVEGKAAAVKVATLENILSRFYSLIALTLNLYLASGVKPVFLLKVKAFPV